MGGCDDGHEGLCRAAGWRLDIEHGAPGRSAALKLLGGETGDSIMLFEETAPIGTDTTFQLHRDSDELAYVLTGEITFKIGEEVTVGGPGTCAFMPRGVPHAWKNTGAETGRVLFLYTPAGAGGFFEERLGRAPGRSMAKRPTRSVGATAGRSSGRRLSSLDLRGDRARNPGLRCSAERPSLQC